MVNAPAMVGRRRRQQKKGALPTSRGVLFFSWRCTMPKHGRLLRHATLGGHIMHARLALSATSAHCSPWFFRYTWFLPTWPAIFLAWQDWSHQIFRSSSSLHVVVGCTLQWRWCRKDLGYPAAFCFDCPEISEHGEQEMRSSHLRCLQFGRQNNNHDDMTTVVSDRMRAMPETPF